MAPDENRALTAADVLRRYQDEHLGEFFELPTDNVNRAGHSGDRPLHVAVARGARDEVTALIEGGADVNAPGDLGNTPLHSAVGQGHLELARLLLIHGASRDARNEDGETPLDLARLLKRSDFFSLLEGR